MCDALVPRKLTPKIVASIDPKQLRFRPKAGDIVHFSHSFANALLYASIGEAMGLPIHIVLAPGHAFVRWRLDEFLLRQLGDQHRIGGDELRVRGLEAHLRRRHQERRLCLPSCLPTRYSPPCTMISGSSGAALGGDWRTSIARRTRLTRIRKAIDSLTHAIELNKKLYEAYFQRGRCWAALKDLDRSLADNSVAIHLDPDQPAAYFGRGVGYLARAEEQKSASMTSSERSTTSIR